MNIRLASIDDLPVINEIYNQSVSTKTSTADLAPTTLDARKEWFQKHNKEHYPIFVAEDENNIIGWIALSPYRPGRKALWHTAEISCYIRKDAQKKGLGSILFKFMIDNCKKYQIKNVFGIIIEHNYASIALVEKFGFKKWGVLPQIVEFDDKTYDHLYYGLKIND